MFMCFSFFQKTGKQKTCIPNWYNLSLFREFSRGKKEKSKSFFLLFRRFSGKKEKGGSIQYFYSTGACRLIESDQLIWKRF